MEILYGQHIKLLRKVVETKAKFQKVMLFFDNSSSALQTREIYDSIKDICIFNQMNIENVNDATSTINDGYKLLIFFTTPDSYLQSDINTVDFISIFIPVGNAILPFFIMNECNFNTQKDYLILKPNAIDVNMISSIFFNKFYMYFQKLINLQSADFNYFDYLTDNLTQINIIDYLQKIGKEANEDYIFEDVGILKKYKIDYQDLPIVDYLLVTGILLVIQSIKEKSLSIVDIYKAVGVDYNLVDKFYAMAKNDFFLKYISLNYNCLNLVCRRTRQKTIEVLNLGYELEYNKVNKIINKIKSYAKQDKGILGYLYFYNVFSV